MADDVPRVVFRAVNERRLAAAKQREAERVQPDPVAEQVIGGDDAAIAIMR